MKTFRLLLPLGVAFVLGGGAAFLASGCGDSSSTEATQVKPMPQDAQDSIRKAMEANKKATAGKRGSAASK